MKDFVSLPLNIFYTCYVEILKISRKYVIVDRNHVFNLKTFSLFKSLFLSISFTCVYLLILIDSFRYDLTCGTLVRITQLVFVVVTEILTSAKSTDVSLATFLCYDYLWNLHKSSNVSSLVLKTEMCEVLQMFNTFRLYKIFSKFLFVKVRSQSLSFLSDKKFLRH